MTYAEAMRVAQEREKNRPRWIAGWNLPGCLPEMEPVVFVSEAAAQNFIRAEQAEVAWHLSEDEEDPYTYWVEPYQG